MSFKQARPCYGGCILSAISRQAHRRPVLAAAFFKRPFWISVPAFFIARKPGFSKPLYENFG